MTTRYFGAPIARNEDRRLLTGQAQFVNDVERPGMPYVAFLRSPHAHARLGAVDLSRLRERPGVVAAYAADDLGDYWKPGPLLVPPPPIEGTTFNQTVPTRLTAGQPPTGWLVRPPGKNRGVRGQCCDRRLRAGGGV
jgi:CO/xanthine dehydrogenase Mo-binding subunit